MKYPKLRELGEAIRALILGPYTSKYPHKPVVAAKRFRGKPTPNNDGCIACMACALVCPARAIEVKESKAKDKPMRTMIWHLDECHFCGQCETYCTTRDEQPAGVKLTGEFELAGFDRKDLISKTDKKELALCEICGDTVTSKAHLDWIARRLGPLAYSNPTVFLSHLKSMGLADESVKAAPDDLTRADRVKVLCAKCRRTTTQEK